MPNNISHAGTAHVKALLDAALESTTGVLVEGLLPGRATYLRGQVHTFRTAERKRMAKAFPIDDPRHGATAYDAIVTEITQPDSSGLCKLRLIKSQGLAAELAVKDLKTGESIDLLQLL